jgi:hypothetical protein
LSPGEIEAALEAGAGEARQLLAAGLIDGVALRLYGETVVIGLSDNRARASRRVAIEGAVHA